MKLFILLLLFSLCLYTITCNGVKYYTFDSGIPGNHTLFIGSIHGNEEAGYYALKQFIYSNFKPIKGKITIIPVANACGLHVASRNNPMGDYDINRTFPDKRILNSAILKLVHKADLVVDIHEGWGFHKIDSYSIGSGIYTKSNNKTEKIVNELIEVVNKDIVDPNKQFTTFKLPPIVGSLQYYCNEKNIDYILIETSGQYNIQPIDIRVNQILKIIKYIIDNRHI